jgi:hypothetical protein
MDLAMLPRPATEQELWEPGVYVILFENPWAVYVGCTPDCFKNRFAKHAHDLCRRAHPCRALQARYDKEESETLMFLVMAIVYGPDEILRQEGACLKIFSEISTCEVLNNPGDWAWKRAREITW